ncbi:MAG TPA: NAD(P)/FAD-dependent oxidoreductase [Acidimicrobiia bacterium]|nr:NAD(P)/FAD-dependent oxidoreductase [Acidimicrobiia bacterium]
MSGTNRYDAVIVGGGHNGLTAAGYLARAGLSVVVLEQREVAGGLCSPLEFFPGYTAAITNSPGSLEPKIVNDLELEKFGLSFIKPDPSLVYPFPDGRVFVGHRDRGRALDEVRKFSEADATVYEEFFRYMEEFAELLDVSVFEPPPPFAELVKNIKGPRAEEMFSKIMFGSMQDFVEEWFESSEIRALIASITTVSNLVGPRTPGTVMRAMLRPISLRSSTVTGDHDPRKVVLRGSTGLPVGGMGAIPTSMADSLVASGGEIRTNARAARISTHDGRVTGVILESGEVFHTGFVLSNANPQITLLDLVDASDLPSEFRDRVSNIKMKGSAFKVGLALDDLPRFAAAADEEEAVAFASCQFRVAPTLDYMELAYDDAKYGRPSQSPMMWGLTPSVTDPQLAPEGKHVMSINVFHAPHELAEGLSWETERDRFGKRAIEVMSEYIPNLADIIVDTRFWSPVDLEREYGLVGAHITHGESMPGSMFSFRPIPGWSDYATPIAGLYMCGAGVWPGGSISGAPGHNAAHKVLADLAAGATIVDGTNTAKRSAQ